MSPGEDDFNALPRLCVYPDDKIMKLSAARVARRVLASVKVEVLPEATEKARAQFGSEIAVGRFLSPIPLFRVFDGEELRQVLDTGEIKGGDYSVPGERAFGAQWGSDKDQVASWGEHQRGKRLGHELFMAEIDGNGRVFAHLSGADRQMQPDSGTLTLNPSFCSTSLGCSVPVMSNAVRAWYIVEGGRPQEISLSDLKEMSGSVGLKPRKVDLFKGALVAYEPKLVKALRVEVFEATEGQNFGYMSRERILRVKELGIGPRDRMDPEKLGKALLKFVCIEDGDCTTWGTSLSKALSAAQPGQADGVSKFAVLCAITAEVAVPHHEADVAGVKGTVKYVDVELPEGGSQRIWQPWGKTPIQISPTGEVTFR